MNVAEVGRADVLAFRTFLKRQKFSGRTLYNHFLNIAFFVWAKGEEDTLGLKDNDWPEKAEHDPEALYRRGDQENYGRPRQERFGDWSARTTRRKLVDHLATMGG